MRPVHAAAAIAPCRPRRCMRTAQIAAACGLCRRQLACTCDLSQAAACMWIGRPQRSPLHRLALLQRLGPVKVLLRCGRGLHMCI